MRNTFSQTNGTLRLLLTIARSASLGVVGCVSLAGSVNAMQAGDAITTKEQHIREQMRQARYMLEEATFDFPSARVRDVVAGMSGDEMTFICGSINGKNRFGAYVGWQRFLIAGDRLISEPQNLDDPVAVRASAAIQTICGSGGALENGGLRNGYTSPTNWTSVLSPTP